MLGRILLLRSLRSTLNENQPPRLALNAKGRPVLVDYPDLHFSITHTGNLVGVILSPSHRVGIDIEQIRPIYQNLVEHVLNEDEVGEFDRFSEKDKATAFFRAWTGKEAFLKAVGTGLSGGLRQVCVPLKSQSSPYQINPTGAEVSTWRIQTLVLPDGYVGSVVWENGDAIVETKWVEEL